VPAKQGRALYEVTERRIVPQLAANLEPEISGVRIHKPRRTAAVSTMTVDENNLGHAHFPSLTNDFSNHFIAMKLAWVIAVQVDFHWRKTINF